MTIRRVFWLLASGALLTCALAGCFHPATSQPQALFSASMAEGTIPFIISFDGTLSFDPDGQIVSYLWNFGDGSAGTGPVVSHEYRTDGVYIVRLTVIDNHGSSAETTLSVDAKNPPPSAAFSYSPRSRVNDSFIVGASEWITFDASDSTDDGTVVEYQWTFGDGETGAGCVVTHRYLWPGTYNVVLRAIDEDGGCGEFIQVVKIVGGPPCNGDLTCDGGSCSADVCLTGTCDATCPTGICDTGGPVAEGGSSQ